MARWLALFNFEDASTRIAAGSVLDDQQVNIDLLRSRGLALVPHDPALDGVVREHLQLARRLGSPNQPSLAAVLLSQGVGGGVGNSPIVSPDVYVHPVTGDNSAIGTQDQPVRTIEEAEARRGDISVPVTIHLAAQQYPMAVFRRRTMNAGIYLLADKAWDPNVETVLETGVAGAGTGGSVLKAVGLGLVLPGDTIELTSGAASGKRRTVLDYTDPDLQPVVPWGGGALPAAGDTFKVTRWATCRLNFSPGAIMAKQYLVGGDARSGNSAQADMGTFAGYCFVGTRLHSDDRFGRALIREATAVFFGCTKTYGGAVLEGEGWTLEAVSSNVGFGCIGSMQGPVFTQQDPLALPSADHWFGWGIHQDATDLVSVVQPTDNSHVRMAGRINYLTLGGTARYFADVHFVGRAEPPPSAFVAPLSVAAPATLRVGRFNYPQSRAVAKNATNACEVDGRTLAYHTGLRVENADLSTVDGDCVRVSGPGSATVANSVTGGASGAGLAVRAQHGGRVMLEGAPQLGGGGNDYDVGNGAPVNKAFFAVAGDHISHTDGSVAQRVS